MGFLPMQILATQIGCAAQCDMVQHIKVSSVVSRQTVGGCLHYVQSNCVLPHSVKYDQVQIK